MRGRSGGNDWGRGSLKVMEPVDVMGAMGALMVEIIDAVVNSKVSDYCRLTSTS